jgi:hypothetical protein
MLASEQAEVLAAARAVYEEFDSAEIRLELAGGAETLPEEFHQWLTDTEFGNTERYAQMLWSNGVHLTGELHDEMTHFIWATEVELQPKTYMAVYVCGKSWGAVSTDADGVILYDGSLTTYRRTVWFAKEGSPLSIKIALINDDWGKTCDA